MECSIGNFNNGITESLGNVISKSSIPGAVLNALSANLGYKVGMNQEAQTCRLKRLKGEDTLLIDDRPVVGIYRESEHNLGCVNMGSCLVAWEIGNYFLEHPKCFLDCARYRAESCRLDDRPPHLPRIALVHRSSALLCKFPMYFEPAEVCKNIKKSPSISNKSSQVSAVMVLGSIVSGS